MKSGRLAVNVLIELNKIGLECKSTFDFINKTIKPEKSDSKESRQLMNDYLNWLPELFKNHNCVLTKLEKFIITFWSDFDKAITSPSMNGTKEFVIYAKTEWKADGKDEQIIEINQTELVKQNLLMTKIPEIN
jgi:hypothetical protein